MAVEQHRFLVLAGLLVAFALCPRASADDPATSQVDAAVSNVDRYGASANVRQAAYNDLSVPGTIPMSPAANANPAAYPQLNSPVDNSTAIIPPESGDWVIAPPSPSPCGPACRTSTWFAGLELLPLESHITRAKFGTWPNDTGFGMRLNLGYEDDTGFGIRARISGMDHDVSAPVEDVDLTAGAFDLDVYKRLFIDDTELVLGTGAAGRGLEFTLSDDSSSEFSGGGLSLFAEAYQPLLRFTKTDIGFVGRGRWTFAEGEWRDSTGTVIPPTDHDTMSIAEAAWGLEFRRRFGCQEDHFWSIGLLSEFQRWDSQWMGHYLGSSIGFSGANIYFNIGW